MGKGEEEKISTLNRILSLFLINVILISLFAHIQQYLQVQKMEK